jgi:hypothetical protein
MKQAVFFISITVLAISCIKRTDNSQFNSPCFDSCTIVQGHFLTGNNEPIANLPIEIKSVFKPTLGIGISSTRNIASGKTDNNGFFSLKFGLNPNEYGQTANTYVSLYFSLDKSTFEPVTWYDNFGTEEFLGGFRRKDTTLDVNIFFASIAKVKVTLENFVPIKTGDKFYVETSCAVGLNRHLSQNDEVDASQNQTEKEIYACGNEQTKLFIIKVKNGVFIETDTTVYTPTGQTVPIKFSY